MLGKDLKELINTHIADNDIVCIGEQDDKFGRYDNKILGVEVRQVGFDNTNISQLSTPSITTISQPQFQLGFLSSELLFEKIHNPLSEVKHLTLNTELIIRESTTS